MALPYAHDIDITVRVNGRAVRAVVHPRTTLLDWLREEVGLTGTKKGCNEGACGTCTVLVDGRRMNGCLTLAVQCDGREVTTVEGLADGRRAEPGPAGLPRPRRLPVRLLHPRPARLGHRLHRRGPRHRRGHRARVDERQHLPLLVVPADHGGCPRGAEASR